eukprot:5232229-Pleurochrysis_carterae.AAC.3
MQSFHLLVNFKFSLFRRELGRMKLSWAYYRTWMRVNGTLPLRAQPLRSELQTVKAEFEMRSKIQICHISHWLRLLQHSSTRAPAQEHKSLLGGARSFVATRRTTQCISVQRALISTVQCTRASCS